MENQLHPLDIFNELTRGNLSCSVLALKGAFQEKLGLDDKLLWDVMKILDINKNGFIDNEEFRIMMLDSDTIGILNRTSSPHAVNDENIQKQGNRIFQGGQY